MNIFKKISKKFLLGCVNHLFKGTRFFRIKRWLLNMCSGVKVEKNVKVVGPIRIPLLSEIEIEADTWVGQNLSFLGNGSVYIGKRCDFAPNVTLVTGSHKIGDEERRAGEGYNGKIVIEDGCWICANVIVLPDVTIERSSVVGAGAVVNKTLSANGVYVGIPAREIKKLKVKE